MADQLRRIRRHSRTVKYRCSQIRIAAVQRSLNVTSDLRIVRFARFCLVRSQVHSGVPCRQPLLNRHVGVLNNHRLMAPMGTLLLIGACARFRRSPDSNAPCPIPPTIAVASWTPTTQSGVIEGTVLRVDSLSDPTPKPIRDAQVVAAGTVQRTTVVDTAGHFRLSGLPDGDYAFTVRGIGFPTRRDSLRVRANGFTGAVRLRTNVVLFPNCCRLRYCL